MTAYLAILNGILWAALGVNVVLVWGEALGRPRAILCDCRIFPYRPHHLDTPYLLGASIGCGVVSVSDLAALMFGDQSLRWWHFAFAVFYALWSLVWYRRWKKHKRGGKHGALAKLLAKVKITAAGLRVVPVPGGNR